MNSNLQHTVFIRVFLSLIGLVLVLPIRSIVDWENNWLIKCIAVDSVVNVT